MGAYIIHTLWYFRGGILSLKTDSMHDGVIKVTKTTQVSIKKV